MKEPITVWPFYSLCGILIYIYFYLIMSYFVVFTWLHFKVSVLLRLLKWPLYAKCYSGRYRGKLQIVFVKQQIKSILMLYSPSTLDRRSPASGVSLQLPEQGVFCSQNRIRERRGMVCSRRRNKMNMTFVLDKKLIVYLQEGSQLVK